MHYQQQCKTMQSFFEKVCLLKGYTQTYCYYRRRQWQPTPVLLPGKSHGQRSLIGCLSMGSQSVGHNFTFTFHFHALEKEMATHSSVLAWRIPGRGSLVGCRLWGRTESDTIEGTQQQQQQPLLYDLETPLIGEILQTYVFILLGSKYWEMLLL